MSGASRAVAPAATTTYILTAANPYGSATAACTVTVNQPPVIGAISIPTFDAQKAMSIVLPAATDPENQALTYTATGLPSGLTFNSSTRTLSGAVAVPGIYSFTYTATDTKGASASTKGTLTVKAAGVIPTGGTTTTIKYDYDTQGRLSTLTYPSGRAAGYTYDDLDRVTTVTYNGQAVVQPITYDGWGNPSSRQFKSGARDEWTYDASGTRVTQWSIGIVGGTPQARAYGYDAADRLTKGGEWTNLAYDANSRLTGAVAPSFSIDNVLAHDAYNNNISSVTTSAGSVPSAMNNFTFDPMVTNHLPGQAKNGGLTGVSENNFGEITAVAAGISASTGLSMTWDGLGRMTSTTYGTSRAVESFRYTASGLRIIRTDSLDANKNRYYAYANDGHMLAKYQFASGANPVIGWCADIIYLGNEAIAQVDGAGAHAFHNDHQGTPRVITSPAGTVEGTQAFGPYGEQIQHSGYSPIIGYTGHILTEPTGLIYMRGRFYSPAWHRFMNSDQGVDPNSINQVAYVCGNPLMSTDPTGLQTWPGSGRVTSPFGTRTDPITGQPGRLHNGIDIANPVGAAVRAFREGTVVSVSTSPNGAHQVVIENDDGIRTGYAHTAPSVAVGQHVDEGEQIGTTDLSGRSTGGHVHFTYSPGDGQGHTDPAVELPAENNYNQVDETRDSSAEPSSVNPNERDCGASGPRSGGENASDGDARSGSRSRNR